MNKESQSQQTTRYEQQLNQLAINQPAEQIRRI